MTTIIDNTRPHTPRSIYARLRGPDITKRGAWVEAWQAEPWRKDLVRLIAARQHGVDIYPIYGEEKRAWVWHGDRLFYYYNTPDNSTHLAIEPSSQGGFEWRIIAG